MLGRLVMCFRWEHGDNVRLVSMLCLFPHLSQDCAGSSYICLKIKPQGCGNQRLDFLEMHLEKDFLFSGLAG